MLRIGQGLVFTGWAGLLMLHGCGSTPTYAPPAQVQDSAPSPHIAMASDPEVGPLLVADIGPLEGGRFRWTGQKPAVRLELPRTDGLKLRARFWVAKEALRANGPLEISYFVNGMLLDRVRYATEGEEVFEKPVDAALLRLGSNDVRMELDRVFQQNNVKLGVALAELGFTD